MSKCKIAFVADCHIGNHRKWSTPSRGLVSPITSRAADVVRVLANARREAEVQGVAHLVVLGDVFDTSCPSPQLVAEAQAALASTAMDVHVIVGNHDQVSDQPGDHGLASMHGWGRIQVYERPEVLYTDGWQVHLVPYRPGRADDYLPDVVTELLEGADNAPQGVDRVLCLHLGLRDKDTAPWLQGAHDSVDAAALPHHLYRYTFAGNWHLRKRVAPRVFQVGALVPTGFDNPGLTGYGSLVVLGEDGPVVAEMAGPRFLRATGPREAQAVLDAVVAAGAEDTACISVRCRPDERADVRELMDLYGVTKYEVHTDREAAQDAARSAAQVAAYASSDSVAKALAAYVAQMPLPDGVDRTEVQAMAVDYVAGAA
jgi:hypothetical protein